MSADDEVIIGEVVQPETVIICEPGHADAARRMMDRRGEYGGLVRESDTCPAGSVVVIDGQKLRKDLEAAIEDSVGKLTVYTPNPTTRFMPWLMAPTYRMPSAYLKVTG